MLVVPYVPGMLQARTARWASDNGASMYELSLADDAYFELLRDLWGRPGALCIVEQDVVPATGVVERMLDCRRPWCTSPYPLAGGRLLTEGLGCVRFSERLKTRHPNLFEIVGQLNDAGHPARTWRYLDVRIVNTVHKLGYSVHTHARSEHLHDYRS